MLKTFTMTSSPVTLVFCFAQIWAANVIAIDADVRIINGQVSSDGQFPYAVALFININDNLGLCGGSLLSDQTILTAAHCLANATEIQVLLGSNYLREMNRSAVSIKPKNYLMHPDYNASVHTNDIGVVYLEKPITFSDKIQPVQLPTEVLTANKSVIALGWGRIKHNQPFPDAIRHAALTTISNVDCRNKYGYIPKNTVCVVGKEDQGTCYGDSGSPLIQITSDGKNVQVGVTSFGAEGCDTEYPSGYTRTFENIDWIKNVTKRSASSTTTSFLSIVIVLYLAVASF